MTDPESDPLQAVTPHQPTLWHDFKSKLPLIVATAALLGLAALIGNLSEADNVSAQNRVPPAISTQVVTQTAEVTATTTVTPSTAAVGPFIANEEAGLTLLRMARTLSPPSQLLNPQMFAALPPTIDISEALQSVTTELQAGMLTETMQTVLEKEAELNALPINTLSARNARLMPLADAAVAALLVERGESSAPEPVADIAHQLITTPYGHEILVRIYTPQGEGPFPVVVYFHGGGWVIADLDSYDASARALTNAAESIVVSVAYRQGPENPFPAAVEDAYIATQWAIANAASFSGDPARVAVVGESAGGNLATVVCLLARERGDPMPVYQLLIYPVVQIVTTDTPSYQSYADARPLNTPLMEWFVARYVLSEMDAMNPYASPLLVEDLSGLPPATIIAAEIDPLLSEGEAYANRLSEAGVPVIYQSFTGVTHEFFGMGAVLDEAQAAVQLAAEGLRSVFDQ